MSETPTQSGTIRVTLTVDSEELREWAGKHADAGQHGVAHVLYCAAQEMETGGLPTQLGRGRADRARPTSELASLRAAVLEEAAVAVEAYLDSTGDDPCHEPTCEICALVRQLATVIRSLAQQDGSSPLADAWDEGVEATSDWVANNPGPSGVLSDPPSNPYRSIAQPITDEGGE